MIPDSANSLGGVLLPLGVRWIDENQWQPVGQTLRYSLAGDPKIRDNLRTGQPITLLIERPNSWLYAVKLTALEAFATVLGGQYTLLWRGTNYNVIFRHVDAPALDFRHIESPAIPIDQDLFEGQIKLLSI